jgi:hypothetical protein
MFSSGYASVRRLIVRFFLPNNSVFLDVAERPGLACNLQNMTASFLDPGWRGKTIPEPVLSGKVFLPPDSLSCPVHFQCCL